MKNYAPKLANLTKNMFWSFKEKNRHFKKNISLLLRRRLIFLQNEVSYVVIGQVFIEFQRFPFLLFFAILAAILFSKMAAIAKKSFFFTFFKSVFKYLFYDTKLILLSPFLKKSPFQTSLPLNVSNIYCMFDTFNTVLTIFQLGGEWSLLASLHGNGFIWKLVILYNRAGAISVFEADVIVTGILVW